jgi:hypothetical protein
MLHNRKTLDRILNTDWELLISAQDEYDRSPPKFSNPTVHIMTTEQPITSHSNPSVTHRIEAFMQNLHFNNGTLMSYGLVTA